MIVEVTKNSCSETLQCGNVFPVCHNIVWKSIDIKLHSAFLYPVPN